MKAAIFSLALACGLPALAAPDWRGMTQECVGLQSEAELAQCVRDGVKAQEAAEQDENDKKTAAAKADLDSLTDPSL